MRRPVDVPTRSTVSFIVERVPPEARIVEVGCGLGDVAAELGRRGYEVLGIESDESAVVAARAQGVSVVGAEWPDCEVGPVDALVFTRSLHHVRSLEGALRRARHVLRPTGTLLVEDFAFEDADRATIRWFLGILRSEAVARLVDPGVDGFANRLLGAGDPETAWSREHDHDLHDAATMTEAISRRFRIRGSESVPYLYRYLVPVLPETTSAAALALEVEREEARRGERGEIVLIGRRISAAR